ncbi:Ubiquitin- ligase E3B [Paramuricea clavata]|nr:Ubiquitin- ligase E3B [Paramuricea clavata]
MFSSHDKTKKDAFVNRSKAARDQRNLGKQQEKAAVKIQAIVRSYLVIVKLRNQIRNETDNVLKSSARLTGVGLFQAIRRFLFIFQEDKDKERFHLICKTCLESMEDKNAKIWYIYPALTKDWALLWITQLKILLVICCRYLKKLKPASGSDSKLISIYLGMIAKFTDCNSWNISLIKGGEKWKPSLSLLCKSILVHLEKNEFYSSLRDLTLSGLCRNDPALRSTQLAAILTLSLRVAEGSGFNEKSMKLFQLNMMSIPGLFLHVTNLSPQTLDLVKQYTLFSRSLQFLNTGNNWSSVFETLRGNYSLCLLANLIYFIDIDKEAFKSNIPEFLSGVTKILADLRSFVSKDKSSLASWHPIFGWYKETCDSQLNSSIRHVTKQLQVLWKRSTIEVLFQSLPPLQLDAEKATAKNKAVDGRKKLLARLITGRFTSRQETNLSSPEVVQIRNTCVMFELVLNSLSQLKMDVLTGLSFNEEFLLRLLKFLQELGPDGGLSLILSYVSSESSQMSTSIQSLLILFCDCCSHLIPIVDDYEMYEQQKPFSLEDLTALSGFLNTLNYKLLWNRPRAKKNAEMVNLLDNTDNMLSSVYQLLMLIYDRDSRRRFTPENHWLIKELKISLFKSELSTGKPRAIEILQMIPHIVPHRERVKIFRNLVQQDKMSLGISNDQDDFSASCIFVKVRRNQLLEDGYKQLSKIPIQKLKATIKIKFVNEYGLDEAGIDQDGVFKEFLEETIKQAFNPQLNLFKLTENQRLYPSPTSCIHDNHLALFEFVGKMLGKAVYEGIVVDVPFAPFFLSLLLSRQHSALYSSIDELPSFDPDLYKNLNYVKNYEGDLTDLGLTFSFDEDFLGKVITHDLKPGGSCVDVTDENKISYIHLMAHYKMCVQLRDQSRAFFHGFREFIQHDWLGIFSGPELQKLISGDSTSLDVSDLRANTTYYGGYHNKHRVINWLWEIVEKDFNESEKSAFLKFVTSCSKPPLLGFAHLRPEFSIRCVETTDDEDEGDSVGSVVRGFFNIGRRKVSASRLPTSSTCFNLLKLPNYARKEILREKLRYAIQSHSGFELS